MNLNLEEVNNIKNEQIKEWELERYYKSLGSNEYRNFLSKRKFKENIQTSLILIIPILLTLIYTLSNNNQIISDISQNKKFTLSEAREFMENRLNNINQSLNGVKVSDAYGTKMYMFLSVAEDGSVCITGVTELELKPVAANCGNVIRKMEEWNKIKSIE